MSLENPQAGAQALREVQRLQAAVEQGALNLLQEPLAPLVARWSTSPVGEQLDLASAFAAEAARLVERKARLAAPSPQDTGRSEPLASEPEEEEAALALAERLAEFKVFQEAAAVLREFEQQAWGRFARQTVTLPDLPLTEGEGSLDRLLAALRGVWERAEQHVREVTRDPVNIRERMREMEALLRAGPLVFDELFAGQTSRRAIVITFLALLELIRMGRARAQQDGPFGRLVIHLRGGSEPGPEETLA